MNEPTQEQIKKLWEWCGQTKVVTYSVESPLLSGTFAYHKQVAFAPLLIGHNIDWNHFNWNQTLDLTNLFKLAVPKLREYFKEVTASFLPEHYHHGTRPIFSKWLDDMEDGKDPALALFWNIWEVIKDE